MAKNLVTHDGARVTIDFSQTLSPFTCCGAVQTPRGTLQTGCCTAADDATAYTAPPRQEVQAPGWRRRCKGARTHACVRAYARRTGPHMASVRARTRAARARAFTPPAQAPALVSQNPGAMTPKPSKVVAGIRPRDRPDPEALAKVRRADVWAFAAASHFCFVLPCSPLLRIQIRALCDHERFSKRDAEEVSLLIVRLPRDEQEVAARSPHAACCTFALLGRGGRTREQLREHTSPPVGSARGLADLASCRACQAAGRADPGGGGVDVRWGWTDC